MTICAELLRIMSGMHPVIRQFHSSKWIEQYQEIQPPRSAEALYAEFKRRNHAN